MRRTGTLRGLALIGIGLVFLGCDSPPAPGASAPGAATPPLSTARSNTPLPKVDVGPDTVEAMHEWTQGGPGDDSVPLVVVIHGLGDRPAAFWKLFQDFPRRAHFVIPAGGLPWDDGFAWWPITGQIDETNMAAGLDAAAKRLMSSIRLWRGDKSAGRPIVTGFSQGGMLSFALAAAYSNEIGEAIPVSGLLPAPLLPAAWPAGEPRPRLVALHGEADSRVPFAYAQKSVASLRALGVDIDFKTYPGVGHTITAGMRRDLFAALSAAVDRQAAAKPGP